MNNWYNKNWCKREQLGIYNLLVVRHKINVEILPDIVNEFASKHIPKPEKGDHLSIREIFMYLTSKDGFGKFLAQVTEKTGKTFKHNKRKKRRSRGEGYDEWFQRCQLDGSFAYNGITDDF